MLLKDIIRHILIRLRLDVTKNLKYDRLTSSIIQKVLKNDSNCIDIGCHKGEILSLILKHVPQGKHFAFEPVPEFYSGLKDNIPPTVTLYPFALSDENGTSGFHWVKNAPAYSGIKKRRYDIQNPDIEKIEVNVKRLDDIIPHDTRIDFIKVDVEGGEFGVFKGAERLLKTYRPTLLFECGKGASEYYGSKPEDIHDFLHTNCQLSIYTLQGFLANDQPVSRADFKMYFDTNKEYYFVASS